MPPDFRKQLAKSHTKLTSRLQKLRDHPLEENGYPDGAFQAVPTEIIKSSPDQPRQIFEEDKLRELSSSIKEKGVLQPVIIRVDEERNIFLVAGERRLRAAKMAGLESIPCIITKGNPAEIALIENLQREDLKPLEEAEALARMIAEYEYTQDQLAQVVNKAKSTISETLSLNKLPDNIKAEVRRAEQYPRRLLVEIAKQKTQDDMIALFDRAKTGRLKSDQVRKIARKSKKPRQRTPAAIACDRSLALSQLLSSLNFAAIEESDKHALLMSLQDLRKLIDKILG
jgi:ParB family chromosome partitioning protein